MIEKLPETINTRLLTANGFAMNIPTDEELKRLYHKINEIIDFLNDAHHEYASIEDVIKQAPISDPFYEQRKWIGCLVEHNVSTNKSGNGYGILTAIIPGDAAPFEINNGEYYAYSVRLPQKEIIYNGENKCI